MGPSAAYWINNSKDLKFLAPGVRPSTARKVLSGEEETDATEFWSIFRAERLSGMAKRDSGFGINQKRSVARAQRSVRGDLEPGEDLARSPAQLPSDQAWSNARRQRQGDDKVQTRDWAVQAYFDTCGSDYASGFDFNTLPQSDASYPIRPSKRLRRPAARKGHLEVADYGDEWTFVPEWMQEEVFGLSEDEGSEVSSSEDHWIVLYET